MGWPAAPKLKKPFLPFAEALALAQILGLASLRESGKGGARRGWVPPIYPAAQTMPTRTAAGGGAATGWAPATLTPAMFQPRKNTFSTSCNVLRAENSNSRI